jgi:signal transduction histidine kinase
MQNISELVEQARDLGEEVELDISGRPPPRMSDAVSLAAYRIVQESLTNARRHAGGVPVHVEVRFEGALLSITVENPTTTVPASNGAMPGVGLAGMLERASAVGGTLTAGPTPDGFRVHAELPCELTR